MQLFSGVDYQDPSECNCTDNNFPVALFWLQVQIYG